MPPSPGRAPAALGSALAAALALGAAVTALAQYRSPVRASSESIALATMVGRFRAPVQCRRSDGSRIELEEAVVFRIDPHAGSGEPALKATFFGIDVADAQGCFNLVNRNLPDRRGVLYLHYRAQERRDTGVSDFRRAARDGRLTYHIHRGRLQVREIDRSDAQPRVYQFGGGEQRMEVRTARPGSDAHRMLSRFHRTDDPELASRRRGLTLAFFGPDDLAFELHVLEDPARSKR